jgi:hypothetical protein
MQLFLDKEDIVVLTGKAHKTKQIIQLRKMGIPFFVNASGNPIIAKIVIEGGKEKLVSDQPWRPKVLGP